MPSTRQPDRILVVDDSAATLEVIQRNLEAAGYSVLTACSVAEAVAELHSSPVDLVITDLKMPEVGGLDLVRFVRENLKDTEVVIITGYPSIGSAVEAVRTGAEDYLAKPFTDEELLDAVRRVLEKRALRLRGRTADPTSAPLGLIGESAAMGAIFRAIEKAATSSATVLITGESGTGKELVARAIHYGSPRAVAPFVPVNCGGIPEGLLESELFGHVKGAFTGATDARAGFFHAADGGSIFLDEISEMSLGMQVKFLRVLQDKHVYMVGSTRSRKVDTRILAATNKDLSRLVKAGVVREDLFYRLNVIPIGVPPLRERGDDVLLLARYFAAKFSQELGRPPVVFSDRVLGIIKNYHWPGNVRELENVVQRLVVMAEGDTVDAPELPAVMRFSVPTESRLNRPLAEVEAEHIRAVLASVGGNKSRAAEILGIDRKTLATKLTQALTHGDGQNRCSE